MASFLALLYIFSQKYLVPLLFVIGLMNFIYGLIEYFAAGRSGGDESRAQKGRLYILRAISWFFVGLVVFSLISFLGWLSSGALRGNLDEGSSRNFGVEIDKERSFLSVPNVPRREDNE